MSDRDPDAREPDGLVGERVARREDAALVTGNAAYTDDLDAPGQAYLAFVRSQRGHASVEDVDASSALERDDVLAVYTWEDVEASDAPGRLPVATSPLDFDPPGQPVLADGRVRYDGQPVAAVVAESRYAASAAASDVSVSYDALDVEVDPEAATDPDATALFEDAADNVAVRGDVGDEAATDAAFAAADRVVELDLENNRVLPTAMEPRAALARRDDADGRLTVTVACQNPHGQRSNLAHALGLAESDVRVVSPDVGGGFGHKGRPYPGEAVTAWAAMQLGRPVKWTATRSGNCRAGTHGRDHRTHAELAVDDDGTIRGIRADTTANAGAYAVDVGPAIAASYGRLLPNAYDVPAVHCETTVVFTNTAPVHAYRGAGRPEAIYVTERLVDAAARELGVDPVALRRQNLVHADDFPHETATGVTLDSGDYERALDEVVDAFDGALDAVERDDGRYVGVGVALHVEDAGSGFESGVVRIHPDGSVQVNAGTHSHGQGHATTYAQIVADELGAAYDDISVSEGDTDQVPQGTGTFGSRSTVVGGNAVAESAREVAEKVREAAASELEAPPEDVVVDDGECHVRGAPGRSVSLADVASAAYGAGDPDPGLEATTFYEAEDSTYPFGAHAAVVAIDPETGEVEVERYVAHDDCGVQVNPTLVEGQIHGGVAQGIGQARSEHAVYGENGSLHTAGLQEYGVPKAGDLPDIETRTTETPSPRNELGVKGIGEGGTIAAPPAVVNAIVDALEPFGVQHLDMPVTDQTVWKAIHGDEE
ncbi:carbon-monoxide dehydrogenase [Halobacterium sp. DL1]|jgi:carbon-monoxide dehydrogenase large subunit|nr:carbon-monoxide dehydrogenase [Halobacterium sp. DL1]